MATFAEQDVLVMSRVTSFADCYEMNGTCVGLTAWLSN